MPKASQPAASLIKEAVAACRRRTNRASSERMRKLRSEHMMQARSEVENLLEDNAHLVSRVAHLQAAARQRANCYTTQGIRGASDNAPDVLTCPPKHCNAPMQSAPNIKHPEAGEESCKVSHRTYASDQKLFLLQVKSGWHHEFNHTHSKVQGHRPHLQSCMQHPIFWMTMASNQN